MSKNLYLDEILVSMQPLLTRTLPGGGENGFTHRVIFHLALQLAHQNQWIGHPIRNLVTLHLLVVKIDVVYVALPFADNLVFSDLGHLPHHLPQLDQCPRHQIQTILFVTKDPGMMRARSQS